jgi:hypothetical protein
MDPRPGQPLTSEDIEMVQRRGVDPHEDLAQPGFRNRHLLDT